MQAEQRRRIPHKAQSDECQSTRVVVGGAARGKNWPHCGMVELSARGQWLHCGCLRQKKTIKNGRPLIGGWAAGQTVQTGDGGHRHSECESAGQVPPRDAQSHLQRHKFTALYRQRQRCGWSHAVRDSDSPACGWPAVTAAQPVNGRGQPQAATALKPAGRISALDSLFDNLEPPPTPAELSTSFLTFNLAISIPLSAIPPSLPPPTLFFPPRCSHCDAP